MSDYKTIKKRKSDHLKIALSDGAQIGCPGFNSYKFTHNSLPEIDFDKIDTSVEFLGKKLNSPLLISCMTGGMVMGGRLNKNLAKAAQVQKIAFGVGSQRAVIENKKLEKTFKVRKFAPKIPVLANIGLVQLNYGFSISEFQKCVDMIQADALVVHINPIQEAIQPEGDRNFEDLLPKLEKVIKKLSVPVIAKEVGFGLSADVAKRLYGVGVKIFDTAGWGGTNWAYVEGKRKGANRRTRELFSDWGIKTADSIAAIDKLRSGKKDIKIIGSGGVRSGVDAAKAICLGADLVGIATPFAKAGLLSQGSVEKLIQQYVLELKISMFGISAKNISELKKANFQSV